MMSMQIYNKETLIEALTDIKRRGWIPNARPGNVGGIGNTIEDILGIEENNLPLPNAAEWELKCQRIGTSSLTTLFHMEPSPRAIKFVPRILLPLYGWSHQEAGTTHPANEMSFRQTINGLSRTNRGFGIVVDRATKRILVSFDSKAVGPVHSAWLNSVDNRVGLDELEPQPYWGFDDLFHKVGTKLLNCFYLRAETRREAGITYFHYTDILILQGLNLNRLISGMESGYLYVDFDARTGHNHGTKFRLRQDRLPELYRTVEVID